MDGAVFSEGAGFEAVALVVAIEVHPPDEGCFVACQAQGVGKGGDAGVQQVIVVPDAIFGGRSGGEEGHAGRDTDGRTAVGVCKSHAGMGQPVQVGRVNQGIPVTAEVIFAVLVGDEQQNIGAIHRDSPLRVRESFRCVDRRDLRVRSGFGRLPSRGGASRLEGPGCVPVRPGRWGR
mgnify:CR=1 FL=1